MGVRKKYDVLSLPEDIVVDVLNRLPPRSIARFNVVCKQWHKYISSSLRSLRWKSSPSTLGCLSYKPKNSLSAKQVVRYVTASIELPTDFNICNFVESISSMPERVETALASHTTTTKRVQKSAIPHGNVVRIIASSKGVLLSVLCTSILAWKSCIYVYNPSTRQSVLIPFPKFFNPTDPVGFACFESPEAVDQLHYMIVSYTYTPHNKKTKAIIQTFSSQTGKWLNVYLPQLDVPQFNTSWGDHQPGVSVVIHNNDEERAGGGGGRQVFYWFEDDTRTRIFAIDAVEGTYWFIEGPPPMTPHDNQIYRERFLGVSGDDKHLYLTSIEAGRLSLWRLKAVAGGASNEVWVLKYTDVHFLKLAIENRCINNNVIDTLCSCLSVIGINPASPNVVYVQMFYYILSFDFHSREVRELDVLPEDDFKTFMHDWYQWPRLLTPLPTSTD